LNKRKGFSNTVKEKESSKKKNHTFKGVGTMKVEGARRECRESSLERKMNSMKNAKE